MADSGPGAVSYILLAIDPGREKCGYALLAVPGAESPSGPRLLTRGIVATTELPALWESWISEHGSLRTVVGAGTGSRMVIQLLADRGACCETINERFTTRRACVRYFQENPPRGWKRWVPRGLLKPGCCVDDLAALIMAEEWLEGQKSP